MIITPDQAQNLLDRAIPGPWRLDDHDNPRTVDAIKPHRLRGVGHPRTYIADVCRPGASPGRDDALAMTAADGTLIAAVPDLAQTIAGMTAQYAVQSKAGALTQLYYGRDVIWTDTELTARQVAHEIGGVVVRRFVTDPEVAS